MDHIASSPLAHLAIATESTDDVISISNIHHKRNADIGADKPSQSFQSELVDMYQKEQTKILRFAHLAEDTLSYDSRLKEVQIVPTESSDAIDAEDTKQLSYVSAVKLREAWQALEKPVTNVPVLEPFVLRKLHVTNHIAIMAMSPLLVAGEGREEERAKRCLVTLIEMLSL